MKMKIPEIPRGRPLRTPWTNEPVHKTTLEHPSDYGFLLPYSSHTSTTQHNPVKTGDNRGCPAICADRAAMMRGGEPSPFVVVHLEENPKCKNENKKTPHDQCWPRLFSTPVPHIMYPPNQCPSCSIILASGDSKGKVVSVARPFSPLWRFQSRVPKNVVSFDSVPNSSAIFTDHSALDASHLPEPCYDHPPSSPLPSIATHIF